MRLSFCAAALVALSACTPSVPDSGVGFESYQDYVRSREAGLNGTAPQNGSAPQTYGGPIVGPAIDSQPLDATSQLVRDTNAALGTTSQPMGTPLPPMGDTSQPTNTSRDSLPAGIARESGEMQGIGGTGISDEQEFSAVSSRETIESDKERLAQQRAQYEVIQPTAMPQRDGNIGPNIVEYALSTNNQVGEQAFSRNNPFRQRQSLGACAQFASADLAQEEFLARGGPSRDGKSLDPDGDGFACAWDPTPFRAAVR